MGMVRMRVMMLGPSFETRGGMTSVSKIILSHDFADFEQCMTTPFLED